jgi:hypothetical protein
LASVQKWESNPPPLIWMKKGTVNMTAVPTTGTLFWTPIKSYFTRVPSQVPLDGEFYHGSPGLPVGLEQVLKFSWSHLVVGTLYVYFNTYFENIISYVLYDFYIGIF